MSIKAGLSLWSLAFEAQAVMTLRMTQFALGGPDVALEASRMVTEKLAASAEAAGLMSQAMLRGAPDGGAAQVVTMLRRRVRANHRRLKKH